MDPNIKKSQNFAYLSEKKSDPRTRIRAIVLSKTKRRKERKLASSVVKTLKIVP